MKIALLIHKDYDFMFDLLDSLVPKLEKHHEITGILCFPNKLTKYKGISIYQKYLEIFGLNVFLRLVWVSLTKRLSIVLNFLCGRKPYSTFKGLCDHFGIEKLDFQDPNDEVVVQWIRENQIDVILQFAGYILKEGIIQSPRVCILNKHAGLLPSNKGVYPIFWSLLFDEPIAVTLHKINEEIDDGEIVYQKIYDRKNGWSVYEYYRAIYYETPDLILESLDLVQKNSQKKLDHKNPPSYHSLPTPNDFELFCKRGLKFV